jgi:outer membrane biosynthesis protein TonB
MTKKLIIFFHIFFVCAFFSNPSSIVKSNYKKVQVHFKSNTKTSSSSRSSQKVAVKKQAHTKPISKNTNPVKKEASKTIPRKKLETKKTEKTPLKVKEVPKPQLKETSIDQIQKETIAKIFEKIDKLEKITNNEPIAKTSIPSEQTANQDFEDSGEISGVIEYLFEILELPGPGQVTVEMFLNKEGKVDKIDILQSENPENSQYLMLKLKDIVLPFHKKGLVPSSMKVCFSNLKA